MAYLEKKTLTLHRSECCTLPFVQKQTIQFGSSWNLTFFNVSFQNTKGGSPLKMFVGVIIRPPARSIAPMAQAMWHYVI